MLPIIILSFLVRIISLNQSLWLDEAISYSAVRNYNLLDIITKFIPGDVHPPLYYLVLKLWTDIFGYSEISLRFPSVIFGVITVWVVYKIGRKLFDEKTGKIAALFLALNPLAIYYSQEARMYSLAMLLVALSVWMFLEKKKWWFGVFWVAVIYTDYLPWLMTPVWGVWGVWGVWALPWLPIIWQQLSASATLAREVPAWGHVVGGLYLKAILLVPIKFIFGRISSYWLMAPVILFYGWIMAQARNKFLWFWLAFPLVAGAIISLKIPIFTYHRFLFVMPAFVILLAAGVKNKKLVTSLICLISLMSLMVFNLNQNFWREDWRGAAKYINSNPGKVLMPSSAQSSALVYYHVNMVEGQSPVYLFRYVQEIFDPEDSLRLKLENSGYILSEQKSFTGVVVWKYLK